MVRRNYLKEFDMQTLNINIKDKETSDKLLWLLKHFNKNEIEILEQNDLIDLKLLSATRQEESIPFEEYLKNEN
jgi:hypothetical protein